MPNPLISIIVPIYKVEPYLRRCLDSIVNQTYTNLEIILVDDGSPDACPQICDEYAIKDKRIVVLHKENGGLSDARNVGTLKATGEYLYYLDSDDELPSDTIETMVTSLKEHPKAETIIGKMYCPQNEALYSEQLFNSTRIFENNKDIRAHFFSQENRLPVNACNKLISKKFLLKNNLFFKRGIIHEDELWMFLVIQKVKYIVCINQDTYIRHLNPGSIMTASSNEKRNESWSIILTEIFNRIDSLFFKKQFLKNLRQLNNIYSHITNQQKKQFKKVWTSVIKCAKQNKHPFLALSVFFHWRFFNILKGHGSGFILWFILEKIP